MRLVFLKNKEITWKASIKYYSFTFSYKDNKILNIDREGRIISFIKQNGTINKITYKRAFNNDWIGIKRAKYSKPRELNKLTDDEVNILFMDISNFIKLINDLFRYNQQYSITQEPNDPMSKLKYTEINSIVLDILLKCTYESHLNDASLYNTIYSKIGVLPPDRYGSLVLQATQGCKYNKCAFCNLYSDIIYNYKDEKQFQIHLQEVLAFMRSSIGRMHSIFLGDANALTIPYNVLLDIFKLLNKKFLFDKNLSLIYKEKPVFNGIYSFLDIFEGFKLTKDNFKELYNYNLKMVYLGIETGADIILKQINKPNTTPKILKIIENCKSALINVSVIFIIGLGGLEHENEHISESLNLINKMNLGPSDIVYLSKLEIQEDSDYQKKINQLGVTNLDEIQLENQSNKFKLRIRSMYRQNQPKISSYVLREFLY